jgi:mercuric ion transport protein
MNQKNEAVIAGTAVGAFGAAGAALMASLCCAGPAVLAVIGTSGAVAGAALEPFRLYFMAASFLLLGVGFWRAYVPEPSVGSCSTRAGRLVRPVLWISLVGTVISTVAPFYLS